MALAANEESSNLQKDVLMLTHGLTKAFAPLSRFSNDLVGAALYSSFDQVSDSVYALGAIYTDKASASQKAFTQNHVVGKKIFKAGTSVGEALNANEDIGFYSSGYRADHLCLNFRAYDGSSQPNIVQLVFQRSDFFAGADPEHLYKKLKNRIADTFKHAKLKTVLKKVNQAIVRYGDDDNGSFELSRKRDMFLMFSDVSGFVKVRKALGDEQAINYAGNMRRQFSNIARHYGGDLYRDEGDGFWMAFPATDFTPAQQKQFFNSRVLPAAYDLSTTYNAMKNVHSEQNVRSSHLKTAITHGRIWASAGNSRYQEGSLEGDGFYIVRDLINSAPRQDSVILFGEDVIPFLPKKEQKNLTSVNVQSGRMGQGKALIIKP